MLTGSPEHALHTLSVDRKKQHHLENKSGTPVRNSRMCGAMPSVTTWYIAKRPPAAFTVDVFYLYLPLTINLADAMLPLGGNALTSMMKSMSKEVLQGSFTNHSL